MKHVRPAVSDCVAIIPQHHRSRPVKAFPYSSNAPVQLLPQGSLMGVIEFSQHSGYPCNTKEPLPGLLRRTDHHHGHRSGTSAYDAVSASASSRSSLSVTPGGAK